MTEHRPFPPSPRRRALARRAGLHAASPVVIGAVACAAALGAVAALGHAAAGRLGAWIAAACRGEAGALGPRDAAGAVVELALPILGAAAAAAVIAQLAQTRSPWLPRRRIAGAPALELDAAARTARTTGELVAAAAIGAVALGWLWFAGPGLARLPDAPLVRAGATSEAGALPLAAALGANAIAALATTWAALGALDAVVRHRALAHALRMTPRDKRDDDRLAGADPRWRRHRAAAPPAGAPSVAGATVVILGDELGAPDGAGSLVAVAIAWDPVRRPIPVRTATGHGARATQLLALARHHRIPIHRDPPLASSLAGVAGDLPEHHWPRLAEIVAAVRRT